MDEFSDGFLKQRLGIRSIQAACLHEKDRGARDKCSGQIDRDLRRRVSGSEQVLLDSQSYLRALDNCHLGNEKIRKLLFVIGGARAGCEINFP